MQSKVLEKKNTLSQKKKEKRKKGKNKRWKGGWRRKRSWKFTRRACRITRASPRVWRKLIGSSQEKPWKFIPWKEFAGLEENLIRELGSLDREACEWLEKASLIKARIRDATFRIICAFHCYKGWFNVNSSRHHACVSSPCARV